MTASSNSFLPEIDTLKLEIIPVESHDSMAEAGRKILLRDFVQMLEKEDGSRSGEDIEDLHDMRVTTRRMRSVFKLLADHYKSKPVRPYIESLRRTGRVLGAVRDLDVMITNLTLYQAALPSDDQTILNAIIEKLDKRRTKTRKKLVEYLDSNNYHKFLAAFYSFLNQPGKAARSISKDGANVYQVRHVLPVTIHEHLATVKAYDTVLDDASAETLHALRIEFKRLRYIISLFGEVLGSTVEGFIAELKHIQDHLGELNDSRIAQEKIQALLDDIQLDDQQSALLETYIDQLEQKEEHLTDTFSEVWEHFNTRTVQRKLSDALLVLR